MSFYGVFIGINHYSSNKINELRCAKRDALAVYSLFSDNFGSDNVELLTDEEATCANIKDAIQQLANCNQDDTVMIYFSGHGSSTHQIIAYDTRIEDIDTTSISLEELTQLFSKIQSKKLFCFLDCCFSGGMGAKVLTIDMVPKNLESVDSLLDRLSGEGRIIFTASKADQEAWEHNRYGHGFFTYYLIDALQGADEAKEGGKVSIYSIFKYVSRKVSDAVSLFGKKQNPTIKGTIDEHVVWPIFKIGNIYKKNFPEISKQPVTEDILSLSNYGLPNYFLNVFSEKISKLNSLQIDAINNYSVLSGEHLVVTAPTSSGKTMIGELAAMRIILTKGDRAIFLLPLKALVNDKYQYFNNTYGSCGVRTIRLTGESTDDIPYLMRGQYDLCLMTYEKFSSLVLSSPFLLEQFGLVVIDEAQMLADFSRGANLEFIITLLRIKRNQGVEPQIILLSAVIGDTNGLEHWLGGKLLRHEERPVPLDEGIITSDCKFKYIESDSQQEKIKNSYITRIYTGKNRDWIIPLVSKLVNEGKQVIVFRATRPEARFVARYLSDSLELPPANTTLNLLPTGDLSISSQNLRGVLQGGVAFHISDLDKSERLIIENQFRSKESKIRVIVATTTLSMGINTPAEAVIIAGLEHPGPSPVPYSIAEYKNIIGRAGRLGFSKRGESYIVASSLKDEHKFWETYVLGKPEDIISRFLSKNTDIRSLIIKIFVAANSKKNIGMSLETIILFLEGSFGAYNQKYIHNDWSWDRQQIVDSINELYSHNLLRKTDTFYALTKLGWLTGQSGLEVKSIVRVIKVLRSLSANEVTDPALITLAQITLELDDIYFPINKRSKNKEPNFWINELEQQNISSSLINSLENNISSLHKKTERAKKAVAILLWITRTSLNEIENILMQFGGIKEVSGAIRGVSSRMCDVLPTIMQIAEILHSNLDLGDRKKRLLSRIELGIPSDVLEIGEKVGGNLTRADYLALIKKNILTPEAFEKTPDQVLLQLFDGNRQKIDIAKESIRKYEEEKVDNLYIPVLEQYKD